MPRKDVCRWILYFMQHLHQTQAKTLADLVTAAVKVRLVSLAEIGRHLGHQTSIAAKHGIKRVDRFLANDRIEPTLAMTGVIRWLSRPSGRLIVSLDWVDLRSFPCLMLAAWHKGRAIPLLWQVLRWEDLARSQNDLEHGLLHLLRAALPEDVEVSVLADRGMGRAEMARVCQRLKFHYVIRIAPTAFIRHPRHTGRLAQMPVKPGQRTFLRQVVYRQHRPVIQHLAVYWPAKRSEPWYLMTDLETLPVKDLTRFYRRRMTIEEYFRDLKSRRTGWGLRLTLIRSPERLGRLLLLLAVAYLLLSALGLFIQRTVEPRVYASNNRAGEGSLFFLARWWIEHGRRPPSLGTILHELRAVLTEELVEENWG